MRKFKQYNKHLKIFLICFFIISASLIVSLSKVKAGSIKVNDTQLKDTITKFEEKKAAAIKKEKGN